jgi:hypothetical protein
MSEKGRESKKKTEERVKEKVGDIIDNLLGGGEIVLWHVDSLLSNDSEISNFATAVVK